MERQTAAHRGRVGIRRRGQPDARRTARTIAEFKRQVLALVFHARAREACRRSASGRANFCGVHDLHGLVWEWVADFNTAMVTGDARGDTGLDRQLFCGSGSQGAKDRANLPGVHALWISQQPQGGLYRPQSRLPLREGLMNSRQIFPRALAGYSRLPPRPRAVRPLCRVPRGTADCCRQTNSLANEEDSAPLTDRSLYQLESIWTNDAARPVRLAELRGQPQVVVMFFASCQYACPLLVHDLKRIESALPNQVRSNVGFVLVSFDSERDTPSALAGYRRRQQLPPGRWALLQGRPDDVQELAALLGVKYKQDVRGQFSHSNIITVLNAEGEVVHQQIGLNQNIDETVSALQRLVSR